MAVRRQSGRHYGCLACQKSTVAALQCKYIMGTLPALQQPYKYMYLVAILGLGIRQGWTMSDMVKYRAALRSFLKLTALVFYHV